jgi:peptide/nickel transport system permease protein
MPFLRKPLPSSGEILAPSPFSMLTKRAFGHGGVMVGGVLVVLIALMAVFAPYLAPHDPYEQDLSKAFLSPAWHRDGTLDHPFGTDGLGRDYLSRIIFGARISLLIGFSVMLMVSVIGTTLGVVAGYYGGRVDMVITFLINTRLSLPSTLVALAVVGFTGGSLRVIVIVLGLLLWDRFAIVSRSRTQQLRSLEYVAAAKASGFSDLRIILTEILPNIANELIVVATLEVANAILYEAAYSFLGFGIQPPLPSWGLMIAEGKSAMFFKPWVINIPGFFLFILLVAVNLLGDGVRDVTAPEGIS